MAYYSAHSTESGAPEKVKGALQRRRVALLTEPLRQVGGAAMGLATMVKSATEAQADVVYYSTHLDEPGAQAKIANAATDVFMDVPQIALAAEPFANRPSHVYEIRWRNLATQETGTYKYGMSSGRVTAAGLSYRAIRQINKWNRGLRQLGFELYHGGLWGRGYPKGNPMYMNRQQALWAERYKVSEYTQLTGAPPVGNQSPTPWTGTVIPPPNLVVHEP